MRSEHGKIVEERPCATSSLKGYLRRRAPGRVIVETCSEAFGVADGLSELAEKDPLCIRLMTAPGVGPITAVQSYAGLTPGENSSSTRKRRTGITKAGSAPLRRVLTQACWTARRCCKQDPLVLWSIRIEQRRGKQIAITA